MFPQTPSTLSEICNDNQHDHMTQIISSHPETVPVLNSFRRILSPMAFERCPSFTPPPLGSTPSPSCTQERHVRSTCSPTPTYDQIITSGIRGDAASVIGVLKIPTAGVTKILIDEHGRLSTPCAFLRLLIAVLGIEMLPVWSIFLIALAGSLVCAAIVWIFVCPWMKRKIASRFPELAVDSMASCHSLPNVFALLLCFDFYM